MANDFILPAVGDSASAWENADGSKTQRVLAGNYKSAVNTSVTPLGSGATFTGTWETSPADGVAVSCLTDNTGTLFFDFSNDGGTTFTTFPSNGFSVSTLHEYHTAKVNGRSFRVRLVNDTGAQSSLALYTYFGPHTHPNSPLNQSLGNDSDAQVVRSQDPEIDLALGRLGGSQVKNKFGYSRGLGLGIVIGTPATWVDLWSYGGQRTAPTASFTPFIASDSASDTSVTYTVAYQDANGVEQEATGIALNGQTPVSAGVTATDVTRIWNDGTVDQVGQVAVAIANNFTSGVPTNQNEVVAASPPDDQQSQVLAFRVPAGKKAIIRKIQISSIRDSGAAGSVVAVLQVKEPSGVWRTRLPLEHSTQSEINEETSGIVLPAGSDVRVRIRDVSDNGTSVQGILVYVLVDE